MFIHSVVKISSAHNKNLVSQLGSQTDLCACNRNVLHYAITRNKWLKKNELKCFLSYRIFLHCTTGYFLYTSRDKRYFFRAKHAKQSQMLKNLQYSHTLEIKTTCKVMSLKPSTIIVKIMALGSGFIP